MSEEAQPALHPPTHPDQEEPVALCYTPNTFYVPEIDTYICAGELLGWINKVDRNAGDTHLKVPDTFIKVRRETTEAA